VADADRSGSSRRSGRWSTPGSVGASAALGELVARAVRTDGIGRTVFLGSVGAEERHGAGHIDGPARIEESLDAPGAPVLPLREVQAVHGPEDPSPRRVAEVLTPEQPRTAVTTTPTTLGAWAHATLRPLLADPRTGQ
jgi:hypothetical protein